MTQTPFWDKVFSTTSWILVFMLIFSSVSIWTFAQPGTDPGPGQPIASAFGVFIAKSFWSSLYTLQAILLAYSKWKKKKNMRKHVLLFTYLTGFFTSILAIYAYGWDGRLIDNVMVSSTAAGCWLYWKFKVDYISTVQFDSEVDELRTDGPPSLQNKE